MSRNRAIDLADCVLAEWEELRKNADRLVQMLTFKQCHLYARCKISMDTAAGIEVTAVVEEEDLLLREQVATLIQLGPIPCYLCYGMVVDLYRKHRRDWDWE